MATVKIVQRTKMAGAYVSIVDVTMSNSYVTGGESITAAQLGMQSITHVNTGFLNGYVFAFDRGANKLQAFGTGAAAGGALQEVAAATNLSADTVRLEVIGY